MDIKEFENYLVMQKQLSKATISKYTEGIKIISKEFGIDVLEISKLKDFIQNKNKILENEKFKSRDSTANRMYSSALNYYEKFLKSIQYKQQLEQSEDLNPDEHDSIYVFVGAFWDDGDQTDRFVNSKIWENGFKDKYAEEVKSIPVGTKIAIKSTGKEKNVPFETDGQYVGFLTIKAIGTVVKNYNDGIKLGVEWKKFEKPKKWYKYIGKYGLWNTIAKINYNEADEPYKDLIEFTFANKEQNYDFITKAFQKKEEEILEEDNNFVGENRIYYGVPGCGKSYIVAKEMDKKENGKKIYDKYIRITFHPEFTHTDFIGQLLPVKDKETGSITYDFVAKPFSEILKEAIHNRTKNYCVIIEEINRGNAPAIFGDIFQLLDRLEENKDAYVKGDSRYPIQYKELLEYINKDIENEEIEEVYIPHNLSIFATMNSNDQNVFVLDTAFKRRWKFIRISNEFEEKEDEEQQKVEIQKLGIKWSSFVEQINERIISIKNIGFNNEDKQIGKYFLSKKEINNEDLFAEKLLAYLWEDVLKFNKEEMFRNPTTLDKLIKDYKEKGKEIFNFEFKE